MPLSYYARPEDDLAKDAIAVTASAEDAEYPAANLIAETAAAPAKLSADTGAWVLEFTAPIVPLAVVLAYQYLDAALTGVAIQGNATDSWGAPAFSQDLVIPPKRRDGPSYQRWTVNPWALLTTPLPDPGGYAFWRLAVGGPNSQNVAVGRLLLLAALRAVDLFHDGDMGQTDRPQDDPGQIVHPTELGVDTLYTIGGPRRSFSSVVLGSDVSAGTAPVQDADDFRALYESAEGRQHPFVFIPFAADNDAWLVRFESSVGERAHRQGGYQRWPFDVREISRGLPWP